MMAMPENLVPVDLPDGEYEGIWSGHVLEWEHEGREVYQETDLGVRGINIPVRFRVVNGKTDESSITVLKQRSV